jgi:hypothetical protein
MKIIMSLLLLSILLFSCAEIVAPSGGEKDTQPPKVKKSSPENYTTNFNSNKIEIKFDEFIKLNSGGGNILISPSLENKPKFELIGKKVIIIFKEKLLKETTYIINFGSSIKDNNEGNILKDYKFIFSTGSFIDSLKIEGKVLNAFNKEAVDNVLVALYKKDEDSVLYKKPLYFTKTNKEGQYSLENLKSNSYQIVALEDKNLNYIFDQENERIAFQEKIITLEENTLNEPLFLYQNIKETKITEQTNKELNHTIFNFNKSFLDLEIDIDTYNENDLLYYSLDKKQLHYWYLNKNKEKTSFYIKTNKEKIDSFTTKLTNNNIKTPFLYKVNSQKINNKNKITIDFPFPITNFNEENLSILKNTIQLKYNFKWSKNNLTLNLSTDNLYDSLIININEGCFTSFHNLNSKSLLDTLTQFNGEISNLIIKTSQYKDFIIELYNNENKLIAVQNVSRETKTYFNNLKQGNYFIRIFKDLNKDGIWNSGLFNLKRQPEKTLIYQSIELKDNWDKEIDIKIQ